MIRLDLNGEFSLPGNKDVTLKKLEDFEGIVGCLPGIESYERDGERYTCRLKLDASSMKTSYLSTISGKMTVGYLGVKDNGLDIEGNGRVAGSSIRIRLHVDVTESGNGTLIKWAVSVDYGIMSKLIGKEKLQAATEENIDKSVKCLEEKLA